MKTVIQEKTKKSFKFKKWAGWIMSVPYLTAVIVFGWYPIFIAFIVAFQEYRFFGPSVFTGLENFKFLWFSTNPITGIVFRNTFYYAGLAIGLVFLVPIIVAIFLMEMKKSVIRIMMILWFIPVGTMAGIILWKWLYNPQYGLFNGILSSLGLPTIGWLNDPYLAMICLVLPGLILFAPGLIYIATLQSIPDELYESAELEGAGFWAKIWHITLPSLRPIMAVMLILSVIGNLQVFDQPFVMTSGGPGMATYSVVMYIFDLAFTQMKFGKATALAVVFFFVIMVLVIVQRKYFKENIDI